MTQPPNEGAVPTIDGGGGRDLLHDRRALAMIGGGVVAVVALGYFVGLPLLHGSSSGAATPVVAHHVHARASVTPTPVTTPPPGAAVVPEPSFRDPFAPLVVAPVVAASSVAPKPTSTPGAVAPTTPVVIATLRVPVPGPTVTTHSTTARYTLRYVSDDFVKATVTLLLNGKSYTVKLGQAFPTPYSPTAASPGPFALSELTTSGTATFLYGSASFAMAPGETQYEN